VLAKEYVTQITGLNNWIDAYKGQIDGLRHELAVAKYQLDQLRYGSPTETAKDETKPIGDQAKSPTETAKHTVGDQASMPDFSLIGLGGVPGRDLLNEIGRRIRRRAGMVLGHSASS
jgi:hypothetical protein